MITNATNKKHMESAETVSMLRKDQEDKDLALIMETDYGRRLLYRILGLAGIYRDSFNQDSKVMAANCGARNIGLQILAEMQRVDPESYVTMLKERIEIEKNDAETIKASLLC